MEPISQAILILLLLSGPESRPYAERLAADLRDRGGQDLPILIGKEAEARLAETGLTPADLLASPGMGKALTGHSPELILIHLEKRVIRGDIGLDAQLWFDGRTERSEGIVGVTGDETEADPYPLVGGKVVRFISHRLTGGEPLATTPTPADIPRLVESEAWAQVLSVLAGKEELTVKDHWWKVLAYSRLDQRDAAVEAWAAMQAAHGGHFLVAGARELLPADARAPGKEPLGEDWGSRVLRDLPEVGPSDGAAEPTSTEEPTTPKEEPVEVSPAGE